MQLADFNRYIENPALLDSVALPELQKLVEQFPYFQSAHTLLTLAAKKHDAGLYQKSLRMTAIISPSRTRLFELVQNTEKQLQAAARPEPVLVPEPPVVKTQEVPVTQVHTEAEHAREELDVLKAAELSTEPVGAVPQVVTEKNPEEILEREIGKQVVTAFVEKEILKTPDLHKPVPKYEPESFGDWLTFLKKNNGQDYESISVEVEKDKAIKARARAKLAAEKESAAAEIGPDGGPDVKKRKMELIDKIIEKNPGLIRAKEEQKFYAPDQKAKESLLENEHLVTETLARIYAMQGSVNKAIRAYEILSLKYPQKSAYFASLIEKLRNNE